MMGIQQKGGDGGTGTAERRQCILKALCRRRHDTIPNLAQEFSVSERTIRRDIEAISLTEPVYTVSGRYAGGVYVMDEYRMDRDYFNDSQTAVIQKILRLAIDHESCGLSESEIRILSALLAQYTKPKRETMKREMI